MPTMTYTLASDTYARWKGRGSPREITPEMRQLIDIVAEVIDSGAYYTNDVCAAVTARYSLTPEQLAAGKGRVENGDWGMEIYYARGVLDEERAAARERESFARLNPQPGKNFKTIVVTANYAVRKFQNATVQTAEVGRVCLTATAGGRTFSLTIPAAGLERGIERAKERAK